MCFLNPFDAKPKPVWHQLEREYPNGKDTICSFRRVGWFVIAVIFSFDNFAAVKPHPDEGV
jgi:hypothetical protein